jgi:putative transposase
LRDAIERIVLQFPGYGYRRVTAALRREGWTVNHKRVLRIMREESPLCQLQRRFVPTTHSAHPFARYPNLIKDIGIGGLDQVWISD